MKRINGKRKIIRHKNWKQRNMKITEMKKNFFLLFIFSIPAVTVALAQEDPKEILQRCYQRCIQLNGGTYSMDVSQKSYNDKKASSHTAECRFLRVEGDSA